MKPPGTNFFFLQIKLKTFIIQREPENGLVGCVELVRSYEEEVNATE